MHVQDDVMHTAPGPSLGFSSRGGPKTRRTGQKPEGGPHFLYTVLDVCSNQGAKREMEGHQFQMGGAGTTEPPRWRRPCTAHRCKNFDFAIHLMTAGFLNTALYKRIATWSSRCAITPLCR